MVACASFAQPGPSTQGAKGPPKGVVEAKAEHYQLEDRVHTATMVGAADASLAPDTARRQQATPALPVSDFLIKGVGGAKLPRKGQV